MATLCAHSMAKRLAWPSLLAAAILNCGGLVCRAGSDDLSTASYWRGTGVPELVTDRIGPVFRNRWRSDVLADVAGAGSRARPTRDLTDVDRRDSSIVDWLPFTEPSQIDLDRLSIPARCGPSPATASAIAQLVVDAARRHGVAPAFALAVATAESRLDRDRNSGKGARGAMQLMPSSAHDLGVTDICDPAQNIDGGVRLLRALLDTYRNPLIAAAAYNAGQANVQKYGGIPPFPETVRFVAEVINRQLGLPAATTAGTHAEAGGAPSDDDNGASTTPFSGKPRQFVLGVLQF